MALQQRQLQKMMRYKRGIFERERYMHYSRTDINGRELMQYYSSSASWAMVIPWSLLSIHLLFYIAGLMLT